MRLHKHQALSNDFLIRLDGEVTPELARAVCARRTGIGADGLISVVGSRWTLYNADGSRAESSGNGLRCAAQALARTKEASELDVVFDTDAGPRRVQLRGNVATVDMGPVVIERVGDLGAEVTTGNPHLVIRVEDVEAVDLLALGREHPSVNVEVIAPGPEPDSLAFRVHERGAGITMACGTGSVAAAAAAHAWGIVGPRVVVHNPGGDVTVLLQDGTATLTGETVWVADVEYPWH